jgi:hypothetical protein
VLAALVAGALPLRAGVSAECVAGYTHRGEVLARAGGDSRLEQLMTAPVQKIELHRSEGKSEAYIVTYQDGSRALFKPAQGRNSVAAETGAYALDQLLGFNMVPPTVPRKLKTGFLRGAREGSLQRFVEGAEESTSAASHALAQSDSFKRMLFFDYLSANPDRNYNYLVKDGRYVLIDNGMAFAAGARPPSVLGASEMRLPPAELERLSRLGESDFLRTLTPHVGEQVARESFARFEGLMRQLGRPLVGP